jgi:hypothetical protein
MRFATVVTALWNTILALHALATPDLQLGRVLDSVLTTVLPRENWSRQYSPAKNRVTISRGLGATLTGVMR